MDRDSIKRLEGEKISELLVGLCCSQGGRELAAELYPSPDKEVVRAWLAETSEAREVWRLHPEVPLRGFADIRRHLDRALAGSWLEPVELWEIKEVLEIARRLKDFFSRQAPRYPMLSSRAEGLSDLREIEEAIEQAVSPEGEVLDHASPRLLHVRQNLEGAREGARRTMESIIRSPQYSRMLQEPIVTIRSGRYVVPVKQEYRSQFPGLIHDQSASGATVFMEPLAAVEVNNQIRRLEAEEEREVEAVLRKLTALIVGDRDAVMETFEKLSYLDFALAKGRLSELMDGVSPELTDREVKIVRGRHPLLRGEVVPLNLELGGDYDVLVISGPNTGGKTVALKTVGLFAVMLQSGLHVPAGEGTRFPVFDNILCDIGDEQSIEDSMSSFSARVTNVVKMLREVTRNSLVLIDELGSGTDPEEGGALAVSILDYFREIGCVVCVTTHLGSVKAYALSTDRVFNASMAFDPVTWQPTYQLVPGVPGQSNALETAARLGVPPRIIERARSFLGPEAFKMEELLRDLARSRQEYEEAKREVILARERLDRETSNLAREREELFEQHRSFLAMAGAELNSLLGEVRREARSLVEEARSRLHREGAQEAWRAVQQARGELSFLEKKVRGLMDKWRVNPPGNPPDKLKPGDWVEIPYFRQKGRVLEPPNEQGEVKIEMGPARVTCRLEELRPAVPDQERLGGYARAVVLEKKKNVAPSIDLRGLPVDVAIEKLDKYLDDAALAGLQEVCIIHGKGTGALRTAVQSHLKRHVQGLSFRTGSPAEGGAGVTIVRLE